MSARWLFAPPLNGIALSSYAVLEIMSCIDVAWPVGMFSVDDPDYIATVGNLAYFYCVKKHQCHQTSLLHFVQHVSAVSLHLLNSQQKRCGLLIRSAKASCTPLTSAERGYVADVLRMSILLHQHHQQDVSWLLGDLMMLILHLIGSDQRSHSGRRQHALANTARVTFTYFVELLLDSHRGVYEV
jgi:hypothetical protein